MAHWWSHRSKKRCNGRILSTAPGTFICPLCGNTYMYKKSLRRHITFECGKEPKFKCTLCDYKAFQKVHLLKHLDRKHLENSRHLWFCSPNQYNNNSYPNSNSLKVIPESD